MSKDKVTIKLPRPLYNRVKNIIEGSGFGSVNEFVVYVLRDLVSMHESSSSELTREEVEKIRQRLKNLGYF
ncbi:MAG: CopG family transcriptional regulator [Candidatus Aminicenantes bacterium 4484_214]|nr:MAG: CopG family transcriptional regulator [Candidatus Aminicenantes bacterium 4484_214]RLE06621.1 MAG: CopG family transcriptional regulator [Candidatus Aminicenantes bacterium]HDJ22872.1 CopG family transcriptional regulator [Candidatus Aminicenantes bacterium]